ncbi:hypothetical protein PV325_010700 [Microctonus aethiopoides]|nr:hypothetical protein PV325_010700 [Microctonus aethiopoides]
MSKLVKAWDIQKESQKEFRYIVWRRVNCRTHGLRERMKQGKRKRAKSENFQVRVRYCREEEHQLQRRPKAPNLKDSTSSSGLTPRIKIGPTSKRPLRRLKGIKWI